MWHSRWSTQEGSRVITQRKPSITLVFEEKYAFPQGGPLEAAAGDAE